MHFLSQKGNSNAGAEAGRTKGTRAGKAKGVARTHSDWQTNSLRHLDSARQLPDRRQIREIPDTLRKKCLLYQFIIIM